MRRCETPSSTPGWCMLALPETHLIRCIDSFSGPSIDLRSANRYVLQRMRSVSARVWWAE